MTGRCVDCDARTTSVRCGPCWKSFRGERPATPPATPPEPPGWNYCNGCGALRGLVTFEGRTRCAPCWQRGGA